MNRTEAESRVLLEGARRLFDEGSIEEGLAAWRDLLSETHLPAEGYDSWVEELAETALRNEQPKVAASCLEYLLDQPAAEDAWRKAGAPLSVARCQARSGRPAEAADSYEKASDHARAAMSWEEAGSSTRALRSWERASAAFSSKGDAYRHALARLNQGVCLFPKEERRGKRLLSDAVSLLEEEADRAEADRRIDRALACYHALIHVGGLAGSHENLAEGFLNCIRLMQQADHPFFVLQYFHDFAEASMDLEEHHAAAEVMREASAWCRRRGMLYSEHFLERAALAFEAAAKGYVASGAPVDLAENALLAALDCHNRRGDACAVHGVYEVLAGLSLPQPRKERYQELHARALEDSMEAPGPAMSWRFRGYYDEETAYPATWRSDLLGGGPGEGDPVEIVAEAVGDETLWEVVRRRSLLVCLQRAQRPAWRTDASQVGEMAAAIAGIGAPLSVEPLARLFESAPAEVRVSIVEATRRLSFAGSLDLVRLALADEVMDVREAGIEAIRHMAFPSAFPGLVRLFRDDDSPELRSRIALTLGRLVGLDQRISRDALDFLLHVLREGAQPEIEADLRMAISGNAGSSSLVTIEHHMAAEPPGDTRTFLDRVVSRIEARRMLEELELGG